MRQPITLALCTLFTAAQAQLHNGGFEDLDTNGIPSYWTTGIELITIGDSIVIDGFRYGVNTTDVHGGTNAAELRSAYNYTLNTGIATRWFASPFETGYGGFPSPDVPVVQHPEAVTFWGKYTAAGGDSGFAEVRVLNAGMDQIGYGALHIGSTSGTYSQLEVPIVYTSPDSAATINILFRTVAPGSDTHLGTRLLVDDVEIEYSTTGMASIEATEITVYPNPVADEVFLSGVERGSAVRVLDAKGREVRSPEPFTGSVPVGGLPAGSYVLEVRSNERFLRTPLMVVR
jgi:hypothetical protein